MLWEPRYLLPKSPYAMISSTIVDNTPMMLTCHWYLLMITFIPWDFIKIYPKEQLCRPMWVYNNYVLHIRIRICVSKAYCRRWTAKEDTIVNFQTVRMKRRTPRKWSWIELFIDQKKHNAKKRERWGSRRVWQT